MGLQRHTSCHRLKYIKNGVNPVRDPVTKNRAECKQTGYYSQTHEGNDRRKKPSRSIVPILKNTILDQ